MTQDTVMRGVLLRSIIKLFQSNWNNNFISVKYGVQRTFSLLVPISREVFAMITECLSRGEGKDLGLQEWRISSFIPVATITQEV